MFLSLMDLIRLQEWESEDKETGDGSLSPLHTEQLNRNAVSTKHFSQGAVGVQGRSTAYGNLESKPV